jgi:hypothetical protein
VSQETQALAGSGETSLTLVVNRDRCVVHRRLGHGGCRALEPAQGTPDANLDVRYGEVVTEAGAKVTNYVRS